MPSGFTAPHEASRRPRLILPSTPPSASFQLERMTIGSRRRQRIGSDTIEVAAAPRSIADIRLRRSSRELKNARWLPRRLMAPISGELAPVLPVARITVRPEGPSAIASVGIAHAPSSATRPASAYGRTHEFEYGSLGWIRTNDPLINSQPQLPLCYQGTDMVEHDVQPCKKIARQSRIRTCSRRSTDFPLAHRKTAYRPGIASRRMINAPYGR